MKKLTAFICIFIALIIGADATALACNWDKITNKPAPETETNAPAPEINVEETEEVTLI